MQGEVELPFVTHRPIEVVYVPSKLYLTSRCLIIQKDRISLSDILRKVRCYALANLRHILQSGRCMIDAALVKM